MTHTMTPTTALAAPARAMPILSVFMRLPFPLMPTPLSWPFTPSDDIACSIPGCLRLTRPLRARPLNWASFSRAGAADDDGVLSLMPFHILCAEDILAWFSRVLPFDSFRYAFNAETLTALPRSGRTLALLFSSPSGVGLLPQSKFGSPSNKNIRAPCEAVALGTLWVSVNRTRGESQKRSTTMYLNQVSLIGFLGKDAELKTTNNNRDYVILSIATGRSWKDKESQEYKRETDWHRIVAWGNLAKFAQKLKKGEHIFVQGELRPHQYGKQVGKGKSKEEVTMYVADIQADTITRLRPGAAGEESEETASNRNSDDQPGIAA